MSSPRSVELWPRLSPVLDRILDAPEEERQGLVAAAFPDEPELQRALAALLEREESLGTFLEESAEQRFAGLVAELGPEVEDAAGATSLGQRVGPYLLAEELGRGGMGVVYAADRDDGEFDQRVALKLIKRGLDTDEILERFRHERQILARLDHVNVARLLDGGVSADGRPYFALELVEGEPITEYCNRQALGIRDRLRLFLDVCAGVSYAHGNLIVHRDLKPSNILVTADGTVKLLDFGIAKLLEDDDESLHARSSPQTLVGGRLLTPEYAAPEQSQEARISTATDVWALGVVLCELLSGRRPRRDASGAVVECRPSVLVADAGGDGAGRVSPRHRRRLRGDLDAIVTEALQTDPVARYPSAEALATDIERHLDQLPLVAKPETLGRRTMKFLRRHAGVAAAVAAVLVALGVGLVAALAQARVARREARTSEEVKQFLIELFESSDPAQARGAEITARELLDRGAERIAGDLDTEPAIRAEMLGTLAEVYLSLGMGPQAQPLAEKALALRRETLGAAAAETAASERLLAAVHLAAGATDEAAPLLTHAIAVHEKHLPASALELAEDLDNQLILLSTRGESEESERLARRALELRLAALGERHVDVATSMNNLAVILRGAGRYEESAELHRRCLALRRDLLGPDHPDVAVSLNNLGAAQRWAGDYHAAEVNFREALALSARVNGEHHPQTVACRNNLASSLQRRGALREAERLYREVAAELDEMVGPDHPNSLVTRHNLAVTLQGLGRLATARQHFEELAAQWAERSADGHPYQAMALNQLAMIDGELGRTDSAAKNLGRALALRRALFGADHVAIAEALLSQAVLALRRNDPGKAQELVERVREHPAAGASGTDSVGTMALLVQAEIDLMRGHPEAALQAAQAADAVYAPQGEGGAVRGAEAHLLAARAHAAMGSEEGVADLRSVVEERRELFGAESWQVAEAQIYLARELGRGDLGSAESGAVAAAAYETLRDTLGEEHRLTRLAAATRNELDR